MSSYQYRKSHCGDKTILRPSYLHNGISYTGKMSSLYWIGALVLQTSQDQCITYTISIISRLWHEEGSVEKFPHWCQGRYEVTISQPVSWLLMTRSQAISKYGIGLVRFEYAGPMNSYQNVTSLANCCVPFPISSELLRVGNILSM